MPKISVCLPVYNGAKYVAQAIDSVQAQSELDFELLIVDDCSTDGSFDICENYAGSDARIRVWRNEKNLGLFNNYNACLANAQGKYIKPFAQDDLIEPDCLKVLGETLDSHAQLTLVSCGRRWIDDDGAELKVVRPFRQDRSIPGREVILYNLLQLNNWVGEPSTVMFRREAAGDGFDPSFYHYGDIEYWFRIVEHASYFYKDRVLCSFRRHSGSTTSKNHAGMFSNLDILQLGKRYRNYLEDVGETEEHFVKRALEVAALNVNHLVENEHLTIEAAVMTTSGREQAFDGALAELRAFKELSFLALRYITDLLAAHDALKCRTAAEREFLEQQLADMKKSTSWRLTAPLRQLSRPTRG